MDKVECKIAIRPIREWVEDKKAGKEGCPPCLITPLAGYYLGALQEAGETKLAAELEEVFGEGDVLTISQKLDTIKADVGEDLSNQLRKLDCFAQTFKPE